MDERARTETSRAAKKCPYCFEEIHIEAVKCRYCRSALDGPPGVRQWHRSHPGKVFLGVASSIAHNCGWPVTLVRLGFVLLSLFHGLGLILYLSLAAAIPGREAGPSKLGRAARVIRRSAEATRASFREEFGPPVGGPARADDGGARGDLAHVVQAR